MAVFAVAENIVSPLGNTASQNFDALMKGNSGISQHNLPAIHKKPFYASLINTPADDNPKSYTRFEKLLIRSISGALSQTGINITNPATGLVISTTKGNVSLLESKNDSGHKLPLHYSAQVVADHFGNPNEPIVVSNACISGITAIITGKRLIDSGQYKHVVVAGADVVSSFVFSGFNSFMAISSQPCRPYDANRDGITLGEAAATIILSRETNDGIRVSGGGGSNDANHISGPSRTGEELAIAIRKALQEAKLQAAEIDFISAHGTATLYNDDMESKALTISALENVPVNSLKGYYGHTLGAAGILESAIVLQSMKAGTIIPTKGFETPGTACPINVTSSIAHKELQHCLKTASGFGGCNAAVIFSK